MPERLCPVCQQPIQGPPERKTCSRACGYALRWARDRKWAPDQRKDLRPLTCPVCGWQGLKPMHVKTCSHECARRQRAERSPIDRTCKDCGAAFRQQSYNPSNVSRCPECRKSDQPRHWLTCPVCEVTVLRETRALTCSASCGALLQWSPRKTYPSRKAQTLAKAARRRMRKMGPDGSIEAINPAVIAERDNWMCGICAAPVDPTLAYPDPLSASIDHTIPLSLGGEHTAANVRLAHFRCNVRRGNRAIA